ncbi:sugar phosphate nucleotidyltransferase, partial [Tenacibaculum halocynthiae]|uniref:sugar phosphate nucleotidyltransferase n=1 Tax=Tenacibaculum halocynthiae TaxID=1254437 RepID=UPI003D64A755
TFPNTGYGYIEYNKSSEEDIKPVNHFRDKPDYETVKSFLPHGNFLWNAGIFMWSAKSVVTALQRNQPELYQLFESGYNVYNT